MRPIIDVASAAEGIALAVRLADSVRASVEGDPDKRRLFERLRGSITLVEEGGVTFTLRFDFGRLTVHAGVVGVPDVTLRGDSQALERLLGAWRSGASTGRGVQRSLAALRGVTVYGLARHPRLFSRLLRLLAS